MLDSLKQAINRGYGTHRGLVRLLLARMELRLGLLREAQQVEWSKARRLVFVCQGNIMRSAYADALAKRRGLPSSSFGLATTTGVGAHPDAIECAARRGIDLRDHVTTDISDFELREGDVVLVMEARQFRRMRAMSLPPGAMLSLLGIWDKGSYPHLHDPNTLSGAYLETCFTRIERAIDSVAQRFPRSPDQTSFSSAAPMSLKKGIGSSTRNT